MQTEIDELKFLRHERSNRIDNQAL
jgi:hypothetical protein